MAINFLQELGLAEDPNAPLPAPVISSDGSMFGMRPPVDPMAAQMPTEAPRQRRSFLDTIGRLSDVIATVGGAQALYQPTLDSREDRTRMIDTEALQRQQTQQKLSMGSEELAALQRAKVGMTVKGLQAIQKAGGDISRALPLLGERSGMSPEEIAALGGVLQQDPNALSGLASMFGQADAPEFGLQPFYAQDKDGNLRAYQIGKDGSIQPIKLGEGESPIDPLKFVDTGDRQVGVGSRSGQPIRVFRKGQSPDNRANNAARVTVAGMRGNKGGAAGDDTGGAVDAALGNLNEIRTIYKTLNDMGAMVSPERGTGENLVSRVRSSAAGQLVEGAVGTKAQTERDRINSIRPALMQSLAKATGMTGKQLDSNADVKLFMQTVTNPSSSFEANNRAIDGLERFLKANAKTGTPAAVPPRNAPRRNLPARGAGKPSVSNW